MVITRTYRIDMNSLYRLRIWRNEEGSIKLLGMLYRLKTLSYYTLTEGITLLYLYINLYYYSYIPSYIAIRPVTCVGEAFPPHVTGLMASVRLRGTGWLTGFPPFRTKQDDRQNDCSPPCKTLQGGGGAPPGHSSTLRST